MAQRLTGPPVRRLGGAGSVLVVASFILGGCAHGDALALVHKACGHVDRSLALYQQSTADASPAAAQADSAAALQQLRDALPLAATAAGEDATWQAFVTTLSESSRVPESDLVIALREQCASVASGQGPAPPPTTAPAPVSTNPTVGQ